MSWAKATVPAAIEWSPPITSGRFPADKTGSTRPRNLRQQREISDRKRALGSPEQPASSRVEEIIDRANKCFFIVLRLKVKTPLSPNISI